jgi:hypothetical protein
MMDL